MDRSRAMPPREAGLVLLVGAPPVAAAIVSHLRIEGFRVVRAGDARTAHRRVRALRPDVIVLDVELRGGDGWELLRDLRAEHPTLPILVWSRCASEPERVHGLELGADDYVPLPGALREVAARLQRRLFRAVGSDPNERRLLRFPGQFWLQPLLRQGFLGGQALGLTPAEFEVLYALALRAGRPLSRGRLAKAALGRASDDRDRTIDVYVARTRRKFECVNPLVSGRAVVRTQHSVGYLFDPRPLETLAPAPGK